MTDLVIHRESSNAITLPSPRTGPISVRRAALPPEGGADVYFIDQLQKKHSKMVGFMPLNQLEKRIASGSVLIAQDPGTTERIGYCIFSDKYFKREDLGIIYHLNITPGRQRGLVGAALVKAAFEACPRGVKLFCCWCAQDLEANYFWEALGFVPIAFRAGSRPRMRKNGEISKPGRTHIFWQRRIHEGDDGPGATPYWYPTETSGGAMKENRIVLPITQGKHWSDAMPMVLPGLEKSEVRDQRSESTSTLAAKAHLTSDLCPLTSAKRTRTRKPKSPAVAARPRRGLWFAPPPGSAATQEGHGQDARATRQDAQAAKPKREKQKNDPRLVAAARELRDRYLEEVNSARLLRAANGKYDVSRPRPRILEAEVSELKRVPLLIAA